MPPAPEAEGLTRRTVLYGGAVTAGLMIAIDFPWGAARAAPVSNPEPVATGQRFNAYIHVAPDDRITFTLPAVEMGQGVYTSQAQCIADELDVALDKVIAEHAPPDQANYGNPIF
ncbi:MAG TPA: molybdopterin cofactor-binding domain-containing protein, partial [Sphingomonas sp.]|nr:molybdopterin cofactor-binding domain-containing protein [Sphingomonas sp.]